MPRRSAAAAAALLLAFLAMPLLTDALPRWAAAKHSDLSGPALRGATEPPSTDGGKSKVRIFRGDFVHSVNFNETEVLVDHVILVKDGRITSVLDASVPGNLEAAAAAAGLSSVKELGRHVDGFRFWLPGFVDTHVHYSQLWNRGLGTDLPLLPWLEKYTYALEDYFVDAGQMDSPTYHAFVDIAYTRAIQHYLSMGITSAMIYATSDTNSTLRLAELCGHYGQRCFVGKVNMDHDDGRGGAFHVYETLEKGYSETVSPLAQPITSARPSSIPCMLPRIHDGLAHKFCLDHYHGPWQNNNSNDHGAERILYLQNSLHVVLLVTQVRFLDEMEKLQCVKDGLVAPVITPRFALACSQAMLDRLGKLAAERNLLVQTHMSENLDEVAAVEKRFGKSYPQVDIH